MRDEGLFVYVLLRTFFITHNKLLEGMILYFIISLWYDDKMNLFFLFLLHLKCFVLVLRFDECANQFFHVLNAQIMQFYLAISDSARIYWIILYYRMYFDDCRSMRWKDDRPVPYVYILWKSRLEGECHSIHLFITIYFISFENVSKEIFILRSLAGNHRKFPLRYHSVLENIENSFSLEMYMKGNRFLNSELFMIYFQGWKSKIAKDIRSHNRISE